MKRYDTMGFESEHGVWVRAVDAEERIRKLEAALRAVQRAHAERHYPKDHYLVVIVNKALGSSLSAGTVDAEERIRELEHHKLVLEDALSHINMICAGAPPHEELEDRTYNGIIDAIQRLTKK